MAFAGGGRTDERLIEQFWGTNSIGHKQCLKNFLLLLEVGDIDLSQKIAGLPQCPIKERFKLTYLSKRTDSNPTYKLTYGQANFVLRMKPPGEKYQHLHRVCVEYEVMSYLYRMGLPVPKMYYMESREGVIGTEFIVMEFVDGITIENNSLPDFAREQRRTVYYSAMETLACLHRLPLGELGLLLDPNKVYDGMTAFWNGQLTTWEGNFRTACPSGNYDVEELFSKMKRLPAPRGRGKCILHHDANLDNFIFDRRTFKVKAWIDWEMCCVGDPLVDLAQSTLPFIPVPREKREMLKGRPQLAALLANPEVPGIPTEDELIALYKRHSGLEFSERELRYAKTMVCLRFISVFQDATDDSDQHESRKKYHKEAIEFLTKAGYSYCPQY